MPVPIPQETDPFAEPGKWVFVNIEWLKIVLGTLSYALNDWYWTGSQDEASGVIQSTLKLIDGIGALLPPETVKEVIKFIESEPYNECQCEGNCEMACNCTNNVRYCDGNLEYRGEDGLWHTLDIASAANVPDEPAEEDLPPVAGDNSCQKAWAVWEALEEYMDGLLATIPGWEVIPIPPEVVVSIPKNPIKWLYDFHKSYPELEYKTAATLVEMATWFPYDFGEINEQWVGEKDTLRDEIVCAMQDVMTREPKLSDKEIQQFKDYTIFNASGNTLEVLYGIMKHVMSESRLKERATSYVMGAEKVCSCAGDEPYSPPDGTEPPDEGCIKVYPGELAQAFYNGESWSYLYTDALAGETGVKVSENLWKTEARGSNGSGSDYFTVGMLFEVDPSAEIIEVRWDWSSSHALGSTGRNYQWAVRDYANDAANSNLVDDQTISTGQSGTVTQALSGIYVTRSRVLLSAFALATSGNTIEISIRNIQFHIRSIADGFDGWVRAGEELCE